MHAQVFPYLQSHAQGHGQTTYEWNHQADYRTMSCAQRNASLCDRGGAGEAYERLGMQYCCCAELLRLAPREGDAVLFFPARADGTKNKIAVHASCPVISHSTGSSTSSGDSTKVVVQQWFHGSPLNEQFALYPEHAKKSEPPERSGRRGKRKRRQQKKERSGA